MDKGGSSGRRVAGSVLIDTSVHPTHASANTELSVTISSVTTAARARTDDLDFGIILDSVVAAARSCHAAARVADVSASSAGAVRAHAVSIPDPY
ncbi:MULTISPECIES: hypothetical protein [Candidatus Ichthyocystis]|uniref:hypothetical protein n=1 Tax=Candidatus Ichthyocystis TaxID=2929841 RepID=UPI000B80B2E8|nr:MULTISPECIES: hypothetical protein [Ichthyocystis]